MEAQQPRHQSTAIRYFNGRRYHVLTTFTRRAFTQTVFINHTRMTSFRMVWFEDL
jgi:hypothetical protein